MAAELTRVMKSRRLIASLNTLDSAIVIGQTGTSEVCSGGNFVDVRFVPKKTDMRYVLFD
jgi:hypothetical protein